MTPPPSSRSSGARRRVGAAVVVDGEDSTRRLLCDALRDAGLSVREARNGLELHTVVGMGLSRGEREPHVVILVMRGAMPMLERLCRSYVRDWDIPVVAITAFGPPDAATRAARMGAMSICDRPFDLERCRTEVFAALAVSRPDQPTGAEESGT